MSTSLHEKTKSLANEEFDPLGNDDGPDRDGGEPDKSLVIRFWAGICGLAVLSLVGAFFTILTSSIILHALSFALNSEYGMQAPWYLYETWKIVFGFEQFLSLALIPTMLLSLIVPILFWRGGLSQRFIISAAIAIVSVNVVQDWQLRGNPLGTRWIRLMQTAACWVSIPLLFQYAPLRTRRLRAFVVACIVFLAFCVSLLTLKEAPNATKMLGWQLLYASGFGFALLRRNWGGVAFMESSLNATAIEKTSTWVMFELMTIVGLVTSFLVWWIRREFIHSPVLLLVPAILGFVFSIISLFFFRSLLRNQLGFANILWTSFLTWAIALLLFAPSFAIAMLQVFPTTWKSWEPEYFAVVSVILGGFGCTFFVGVLLIAALWLRRCGWRYMYSGEAG